MRAQQICYRSSNVPYQFLSLSLSRSLSAFNQRAELQAAEVVRELAAEDGRRSCICASLDMGLPCASRTCHVSPRAQRPAQPPHPRPHITVKGGKQSCIFIGQRVRVRAGERSVRPPSQRLWVCLHRHLGTLCTILRFLHPDLPQFALDTICKFVN